VIAGQTAQVKPFADFDALANERVSTLRDMAQSRFDWDQALRDLARAVPRDVTLKTLNGSVSASSASGGGALRSAITAPAITLTGCAPGQTQVARLMARLNNIDGVTRVSLSKSDKVATAATTGTTGTDAQVRNTVPCGAGAHPDFEVVVFFGKTPAAVTAASTAGTPGATPAATPTPTPAAGATATPAPGSTTGTTTTASTSQGGATP
jgi:hypothetical protein